jgi:YD repeat-containing protein
VARLHFWLCAFDPFNQSGTTDYRANGTKVTTYTDAGAGSGALTHSTRYDIAGSVMSADLDCCQQKSFTYSGAGSGGDHDYAYPISVTSGSGGTTLTRSATYDHHTGLVGTATDANGQVTTYYYDSNSLRIAYVQYPNGATTHFYYGDGLSGNSYTNGLHYFVNISTMCVV